jgi:hypothetical protein
MPNSQANEFRSATAFCAFGVILLGIVFLTPDAGRTSHHSFFAVAIDSVWGRLFDWAAAWCSVKIILLSAAILLVIGAVGNGLMNRWNGLLGLALLATMIFPVMLGLFGIYELVKALL